MHRATRHVHSRPIRTHSSEEFRLIRVAGHRHAIPTVDFPRGATSRKFTASGMLEAPQIGWSTSSVCAGGRASITPSANKRPDLIARSIFVVGGVVELS